MKSFVGSLVILGACASDPVQVGGDYTVGVTDRDNGCNFENWTVGAMNSGIPISISQNGTKVTATVNGLTGAYLNVIFGTMAYDGTVDGSALDLELQGSHALTKGNCAYTFNSQIIATANGDLITGKINYLPATNGNSDCTTMMIEGCLSYQDFTGSRPPQ